MVPIGLVVFIVSFVVYLWFSSDDSTAWIMCERFIEARSTVPDIVFDEQDAVIFEAEEGRWVVRSQVDQGNGMEGLPLRSPR